MDCSLRFFGIVGSQAAHKPFIIQIEPKVRMYFRSKVVKKSVQYQGEEVVVFTSQRIKS